MFIYLAWHKVSLTLSYQYNQAQGSENNFKTLYFVQASGWSIHQFKHPILLPYNNCFTWSRQCHILQTILNKVLCILCLTAIYYGQFQFFVWKRNQLQNVLFFFTLFLFCLSFSHLVSFHHMLNNVHTCQILKLNDAWDSKTPIRATDTIDNFESMLVPFSVCFRFPIYLKRENELFWVIPSSNLEGSSLYL